MFNLHAPYIRQNKLIDISTSLPQNSLHDSQSRENLKLEKEFTQSRSERGEERGEERGNTVKARAEIETGNEREERERLTAIVSQESTLALLKASASVWAREGGKETTKGR